MKNNKYNKSHLKGKRRASTFDAERGHELRGPSVPFLSPSRSSRRAPSSLLQVTRGSQHTQQESRCESPGFVPELSTQSSITGGITSMWRCSGHNKAASSSPNATRGQRSWSRAIASPPSRDDLLPHLVLWLLMLGESLHQASKEPKESRAKPQKGCSEVLPAARLPR